MNNANLQTALDAFQSSLTARLAAKAPTAVNADNALSISGKTATSMVADQAAELANHAARGDNPHGTTAGQVGAYTKAEVTSLVNTLVPLDKLPISFFGDNTEDPIATSYATLTFNIIGNVPVLLAGKHVVIPGYQITVLANKTTYLFVRLVNGTPTMVVEAKDPTDTAITPESLTNMLVAVIRATSTIFHASVFKRRRLGVSTVPPMPMIDKRYRVISRGLADVNWGTWTCGLWWKDELLTSGSRGLNVIEFRNGRIYKCDIFDTCGYASESDRFAARINELATGVAVLIYVFDEAANALTQTAINAMGTIGVVPSDISGNLHYRTAMVILGRKGHAQGSVQVALSGAVDSDVDATVMLTFDVNEASGFHNISTEKYGHFSRNL